MIEHLSDNLHNATLNRRLKMERALALSRASEMTVRHFRKIVVHSGKSFHLGRRPTPNRRYIHFLAVLRQNTA